MHGWDTPLRFSCSGLNVVGQSSCDSMKLMAWLMRTSTLSEIRRRGQASKSGLDAFGALHDRRARLDAHAVALRTRRAAGAGAGGGEGALRRGFVRARAPAARAPRSELRRARRGEEGACRGRAVLGGF